VLPGVHEGGFERRRRIMTTHEIRVRCFSLLDLDDLNRIVEIERASFPIDAFSKATLRRLYHKCPDLFIIAEIPGIIVGYMITCIFPEKGDIVSIAIDPAYRRKGVGRTLVDFAFYNLKIFGVKVVELEVRTTNIEGIRFWESLGFFPIGTIPHFYRDGAEALRMRKSLGDSTIAICRRRNQQDGISIGQ
jgi:ribosomal-protein-alanine N-acetyltransferase